MASADKTMEGRVCLITGATSGIGRVTARVLAGKGATVVVHGRSREKCEAVVKEIRENTGSTRVEYMLADLAGLDDVRKLASDFKAKYKRLDVLLNNAGAVYMKRQETVDGFEMTFSVNHLSHFLLTYLLLDVLKTSAPSRIINVSSRAHERARMNFGDLQAKNGYSGMRAYGQSKLANVLFTYELARRLAGTGITANSLHPGFIATNFGMNNSLMKILRPIVRLIAISEEAGAKTSIYLASSPEMENVSGKYFVNEKAVESSNVSYSRDDAKRLWVMSLEMARLKD